MITSVLKQFSFEAAHFLPNVPEEHKCKRMHGHSYRVTVEVDGQVDEHSGMVIDYEVVSKAFDEHVFAVLDHQVLNTIPGLENSTSEILAHWIFDRLDDALPPEVSLLYVTVLETATAGARVTREQ
jgi:6-pyruvoyltetrahydropterin/6-carboxytetrahydropterin synthase